jgi:hypothetical protein
VSDCEGRQHAPQTECLRAQFAAHPLIAGGGGVAFVEHQIDDLPHGIEPSLPLRFRRELEPHLRRGEGAFGPHDALRDRRCRGQERAGDVLRAQATDQLQGEGRARVRRQDRVTRHEDQPEKVVGEVTVDDLVEFVLHRRWLGSGDELVLTALGVAAADPVDGEEPRCRDQPGRRVVRHALVPPLLDRCDEGVLGDFLGRVQVTDQAHQPGDQTRRLDAPQGRQPPVELIP